jgi:cytochrome c biogenesis protein CcmG, thiol:disulfide interchange protein DsbE
VPARAPIAFVLALAVLAAGCGADKPRSAATQADFKRALAGSPAPLAGLYARPGALVSGGPDGFRRELRRLRGHPVVVNKWASWCVPCRSEFPLFQAEAVKQGKKVAFLGVNAGDSTDPAHRFLKSEPLPYPSYLDHDEDIAKSIRAPANYPVTVFFDRRGKLAYVHQGAYRNQSDLADDMRRYLP